MILKSLISLYEILEIFNIFKTVLEEICEPFLQPHEAPRSKVSACNFLKYRAQSVTNCLQLGG